MKLRRLEPKRGNLVVYIVLLGFALFAMVNSCGKPTADSGDTTSGDTIRVAIEISPLGVSTSNDTLSGFYYDMIRRIADDNGLKLRISGFTQVSSALEGLDNGSYDLVIADIPVTRNLRDSYLFTDPIYADREVLVQLKDSVTGQPPYTSQSQLRGATVYLAASSPFLTRIRNLSREIGDTIYVIQDSEYGPEQLMLLTALGEIPNVVVNEQVAKALAADYPQLDTSLRLSFNQFQSWALAPSDTLLRDSLNLYIARFKQSKAFNELLNRYFNSHPTMP